MRSKKNYSHLQSTIIAGWWIKDNHQHQVLIEISRCISTMKSTSSIRKRLDRHLKIMSLMEWTSSLRLTQHLKTLPGDHKKTLTKEPWTTISTSIKERRRALTILSFRKQLVSWPFTLSCRHPGLKLITSEKVCRQLICKEATLTTKSLIRKRTQLIWIEWRLWRSILITVRW